MPTGKDDSDCATTGSTRRGFLTSRRSSCPSFAKATSSSWTISVVTSSFARLGSNSSSCRNTHPPEPHRTSLRQAQASLRKSVRDKSKPSARRSVKSSEHSRPKDAPTISEIQAMHQPKSSCFWRLPRPAGAPAPFTAAAGEEKAPGGCSFAGAKAVLDGREGGACVRQPPSLVVARQRPNRDEVPARRHRRRIETGPACIGTKGPQAH
jgi:hypothetical protein